MVKLIDPADIKQKVFVRTGQVSYRKLSELLSINRRTIARMFRGEKVQITSIEPIAKLMECPLTDIAEPA